ncbi:MAG: type VI secretion system contractile sheath small subunit [Planctomycetes bacterium]|nr:type VI secretion system contractile sheath small subunit [Planctomycetota bacterium]
MAVQDEVPKSRITLRYRTEVDGEPADIQLPLRLLIMGDFSLGTSKDRKLDLEERKIRNLDGTNTKAVMKDMNMSIKAEVPNKIDPENSENLAVDLPITSLKSFSPDEVAQNVPKLRALMTMRKLLLEMNSSMGNSKELRKLVSQLYADEGAFNKLREDLKAFEGLKVPAGAAPAAAE